MPFRIMVIDDDAVACEFLQEALRRADYDVEAHTSGQAAPEGGSVPLRSGYFRYPDAGYGRAAVAAADS